MSSKDERNLFRLAAVLYADDNYSISRVQLHKKILENALFELKATDWLNITSVAEFIHESYSLTFTEEEILTLANHEKFKDEVFRSYQDRDDAFIALSPQRVETLNRRVEIPSIFKYIDDYATSNHYDLKQAKDVISHFLHSVFTQNVENFRRLIDNSSLALDSVSLLSTLSSRDKQLINGFLNWENEDKNKAIFRIASYALEYCLLTNENNTSIDLNSLRNKRFYLDTNIIYRALGINGDLRQTRTRSLLRKFKDIRETLYISKVTEAEFNNSISYYIDRIQRYENPRINAKIIIDEPDLNSEFFKFYQQWRLNRANPSLDLFKAHLLTLYDNFKKDFGIVVDVFSPYDLEAEETIKIIDSYCDGIRGFKPKAYKGKVTHDAKNILWIEKLTADRPKNIYEAKAFLLSSDHKLQLWDYSRDERVPFVFLPSQWLSVSLRFVERTDDDYSSFVSFLNLPIQDRLLDTEQMYAILSGISEYTSDYTQQSEIFHKFIEVKTEKALSSQKSENLIAESKIFAKSELEIKLQQTESSLEKANEIIAKQEAEKRAAELLSAEVKTSHEEQVGKLVKRVREKDEELGQKSEQIASLSDEVRSLRRFRKRVKTVFKIIGLSLYGLLLVGAVVLLLFLHDCDWNYIHSASEWLNSQGETERNIGAIIAVAIYGTLGGFWVKLFRNFIGAKKGSIS